MSMGQFGVDYKKMFGGLPSETLKNGAVLTRKWRLDSQLKNNISVILRLNNYNLYL